MTSEVICYSSRYTADLGQLKFDVDQNSKFISSISNKCPYYILICSPNYPVGRFYIQLLVADSLASTTQTRPSGPGYVWTMRPTIQLSRHFTGINNGNSSQICSCKECLGPNSSCVGSPHDHQGLSSCQLSLSQKPYLLPYCQQLRPDHLRSMFPDVKTCRVTQFDSCLFVSLALSTADANGIGSSV